MVRASKGCCVSQRSADYEPMFLSSVWRATEQDLPFKKALARAWSGKLLQLVFERTLLLGLGEARSAKRRLRSPVGIEISSLVCGSAPGAGHLAMLDE